MAKRRLRVIIEGDYLLEDPPLADPWAQSGSNEENRSIHGALLRAGVDVVTDLNPARFQQKFVVRDPGGDCSGSHRLGQLHLTDTGTNPQVGSSVRG